MSDRIYLDHAATTAIRPEVLEVMLPLFEGYNPSSLHAEGRRARAALDAARDEIATHLGASRKEIVFCGSGSEADNLAIFGLARSTKLRGRHIVTAATEHHAVLRAFEALREEGFELEMMPVASDGSIDPALFRATLRPDTILASIMMANNETGAIAPIAELARIAGEQNIAFHTDAVQAATYFDIDFHALGATTLAISSHKFYGPKGVGVLCLRSGTPLAPIIMGGGQEFGLRSGTENVAGIVGTAVALRLAAAERRETAARVATLRNRLESQLMAQITGVEVIRPMMRLPHITNLAFAGVSGEELAMRLDLDGVAVSTGSACASGAVEPSHVLAALGLSRDRSLSSIRISLGRTTTLEHLELATARIVDAVAGLRALAGTVA